MDDSLHTPSYNMKVVVQETGLKPDTLRAWERRYGIPNPHRTSGGHRLYSQHQLDMLKWIIRRQDEGMSISHVIELWQQLVAKGEDPLLMDAQEPLAPPTSHFELSGNALDDLRMGWLNACLNFDEYEAQQILSLAFAQFPIETVCHELLQKNLNRIGQMWYEGEATVQQEHFCSALAGRHLETLMSTLPRPTHDVKLVMACGPQEQHTFGVLLLTFLCRRRGWDVVYLGANVPEVRLETIVQAVSPNLVVLSAQTLYAAGEMISMARLLHGLNTPMAYGGAVFGYLEKARQYVPGHYLGNDLMHAPDRIEQLLWEKASLVSVPEIPEGCKTAVSHFIRNRSAIDAFVEFTMDGGALSPRQVQNANNDLGNNIVSALQLGDINLLTASINWLKGLLVNYHHLMPPDAVETYINTYYQGLEAQLNANEGKMLLDWFERTRRSNALAERLRIPR